MRTLVEVGIWDKAARKTLRVVKWPRLGASSAWRVTSAGHTKALGYGVMRGGQGPGQLQFRTTEGLGKP